MKSNRKEKMLNAASLCDIARSTAPWYSPMRLFFILGAKYARFRARNL